MQTLLPDLIYGLRVLKNRPVFTLIAVITLALGLGANAIVFSTADALMLRPFNFAGQDRLMTIWETQASAGISRSEVAPGNFVDWLAQNASFETLIAMEQTWFDLVAGDQPERLSGYRVSADMFITLGVKAALGRTLLPEDGEPGREQVAVLHYDLWQRRFGSQADLIGRTVKLNNREVTIVGVMSRRTSISPITLARYGRRYRSARKSDSITAIIISM